jgi:hypothetical protein
MLCCDPPNDLRAKFLYVDNPPRSAQILLAFRIDQHHSTLVLPLQRPKWQAKTETFIL